MPNFSNVHAELDNHELHPPRDFSVADNDTFLAKNPLGDIQWLDSFWQRPVLAFTDATLPPPATAHGNRYVLAATVGSTAMDTSLDSTALPDDTVHPAWGDATVGDIVEYYQTDNQAQPVLAWRTISPQAGYQVFNLTDKCLYSYTGTAWQKLTTSSGSAPAPAQLQGTYAELETLAATSALLPGTRYYVSDKGLILTAVSPTAFSTDGDHTRALPSRGYLELSSGTAGSVDAVQADGIELLAAPVAFTTSLTETATAVATAINSVSDAHGFYALSIGNRVYLADAAENGTASNGMPITATATGITFVSGDFGYGRNTGQQWFKVKYEFAADQITEMADHKGNIVRCTPAGATALGIDPYTLFPWAYPTVMGNTVTDSIMYVYPTDGVVQGNVLSGGSMLMANVASGGTITENRLGAQSLLKVQLPGGGLFGRNELQQSTADLSFSGGLIVDLTAHLSTLNGRGMGNTQWLLNRFDSTTITAHGAALVMYRNQYTVSELTANGNLTILVTNEVLASEVDLTDVAGGFNFSKNRITNGSSISLQRADGDFGNNTINGSEIMANDANTSIQGNTITHYSELNLREYTGSDFDNNTIMASVMNLSDSSLPFRWNQVAHSEVQMERHTGSCRYNTFHDSTITSNDSASDIHNNHIDFSTLKLSNTASEFSSNKATYYSTFDMDGFLGERALMCEVMKGSSLICSGNDQEQGRIILDEITTLDISNTNSILYLSNFKFPYSTIRLTSSQINATCTIENSTIQHFVSLETDGTLDLTIDNVQYGGKYNITSTGTLTGITGLASLPSTFYLYSATSGGVDIDTTAANISVVNDTSIGTMYGTSNHYVKLSKTDSGGLIITEALQVEFSSELIVCIRSELVVNYQLPSWEGRRLLCCSDEID